MDMSNEIQALTLTAACGWEEIPGGRPGASIAVGVNVVYGDVDGNHRAWRPGAPVLVPIRAKATG